MKILKRQMSTIESLRKENDELKNDFFQKHYKESECQELLSVKEAWRKERMHNIDLEAEIERLTTLSELGNMRANDYRTMRDRALKAEAGIERLRSMNQAKLDTIHDLMAELETVKAEAVKEFAERLKSVSQWLPLTAIPDRFVTVNAIDNLLKEMVGEQG